VPLTVEPPGPYPRRPAPSPLRPAFDERRRPLARSTLQALAQGQIDLEDALRRVVDEVVATLGADRGTLFLVDHARRELVSRIAHLPELAEIRLHLGEGVAGEVAVTGRSVTLPEAHGEPRFAPRIDVATGYRTRSLVAVPVRGVDDAVIGVLQVLNKRRGPFDAEDVARLESLAAELGDALARTSLASQLQPDAARPLAYRFNHLVGESPRMLAVFRQVSRAARTDATVLLRGESGTGKEVVARALHINSPRGDGPWVKVDCAALPATLVENELFGHERGAFTGADRSATGKVEAADGGTLFLDEVGELPLAVQGKLLRLLQDRNFVRVGGSQALAVDLRFVCATHRDLEAEVQAGRFRADLYYRIKVVEIGLPPLRARGAADLDRLIDHFFFEHCRRHGRPNLRLGPAGRAALHRHAWPGNVRELEHCIESAVVLAEGDEAVIALDSSEAIAQEHHHVAHQNLRSNLENSSPVEARFETPIAPLRDVERAYLAHVLTACGGNQSEAARRLGIGRNTLARKLRELAEAPEPAA
jgi:Nif-specific regulatory protein